MIFCGIYQIKNTKNNKVYIGKSKNINHRFNGHKSSLRKNSHRNRHLQKAYNKYGLEVFEFSIIEICEETFLEEREIYHIKKNNSRSPNGYNLTDGGGSLGRPLSQETKDKISNYFQVFGSPMKGKKLSEESKKKISDANKGLKKNINPEWRNKITQAITAIKQEGTSSKYLGVSWCFRDKIFRVYLKGKPYGSFVDEIEAAKRFDEVSWSLFHNPEKLNFPENYTKT